MVEDRETAIAAHYASGNLRDRIAGALAQLDDEPSIAVLAPADEFHLGGRPASAHLIGQLALESTDVVLDIGSGIGELARFIAATTGARVVGVDLTDEFVHVAEWLTTLVAGVGNRVSFHLGNATTLDFGDAAFDAATMMHVGMNVADKAGLFAEVGRVLRPGGIFAIYDIVATGDVATEPADALQRHLTYPLPWASGPGTSSVEPLGAYSDALERAGFEVLTINDRTEAVVAFLARAAAGARTDAPPPLGPHLVMGSAAPTKIANVVSAVRAGLLAPTEIIARAGGH